MNKITIGGQVYLIDSVNPDGTLHATLDTGISDPSVGVQDSALMTKDEIIALAQDLTGHKADDRVDYDKLFLFRHQKFVQRKKYWWRQRVLEFTVQRGKQTYELASTVDMGADNAHRDIQNFESAALYDGNDELVADLSPIVDSAEKMKVYKAKSPGIPGRYMWDLGSISRLRFDLVPDGEYKFVGSYWAVSGTGQDDFLSSGIAIVPPYLYHCLIAGLVMDIQLFLNGAKDGEYLAAKASYDESCESADADRDFAPSIMELRTGEAAVNASRG